MPTTLVIDADGIAFTAAAAVQKGIRWDDDVFTYHADFGEAQRAFSEAIEKLQKAAGDEDAHVVLAYSCPSRRYFRHALFPDYKGNRKGSPPPLCYGALKEWSATEYDTKTKPGLEADDVVGILATHPKIIKGTKIVVSHDKDLLQIPGLHLSPSAPSEGVFRVSEGHATRQLWMQVLTGDSTDNYPGIPGVGPKKAEAILEGVTADHADVVLKAYLKAGLTAEDMTTQVNVARILKHTDYNFKKAEPILWQVT